MNDEIKEINIKIPGQILDYVDTKEHLLELYNYITNLQQENEKLLSENITIKSIRYMVDEVIYKSRIEKAVEYINENIADIDFIKENYNIETFNDFDISIKNVEDLLNILNGRSDE